MVPPAFSTIPPSPQILQSIYLALTYTSSSHISSRLGEEGQDAGGLLREWYVIISREIFNPNYALFKSSAGDRVTYTINDFSHINSNHLDYFKFVGRVIAKVN